MKSVNEKNLRKLKNRKEAELPCGSDFLFNYIVTMKHTLLPG